MSTTSGSPPRSQAPPTASEVSSSSSRSTSSYGQLLERPRFTLAAEQSIVSSLVDPEHDSIVDTTSSPPQSTTSDTLDAVRDQAAHTVVLRALRHSEVIDGTKVGVILTLPHLSGEQFLKAIASRLKRAMLPKQESYLFILALPTQGLSPVLVCSSSEALAERGGLLVSTKLLGRIERYELRHGRWGALVRNLCTTLHDEAAFWDSVRKAARRPIDPLVPPPGSRSIAQILDQARARLQRITPQHAFEELQDAHAPWPVVLVDIRPEAQRRAYGGIMGALVVERNVLEWRFDPRCAYRLPIADRYDLRVIVFCQESYTSSLAAAALHDLGMLNATDMIGGYAAWKQAGLPDEVEVSSTAPPTEGRVSVPVEDH